MDKDKKFIRNLEKWKFKEMEIPKKGYYLLIFAIILFVLGMTFNFQAISKNEGRMPVLFKNTSLNYSTEEHFAINPENLGEIRYLYLSDIYHIRGNYISIGDIFMFIGLILSFSSAVIITYNLTIDTRIRYIKWRMKR